MRVPLAWPPPGRRFDVVTVGQNSMDLLAAVSRFPRPDTKAALAGFSRQPGGEAASTAVGLARLGWKTKYIGRFGDDDFGAEGRQALADEGVDVADAPLLPGVASRFALILVEAGPGGTRTVLWHRDEGLTLRPADIADAALAETRVLHADAHELDAVTSAARRARAAGVATVVDVEAARPGLDALLASIDVVIAAEGFPEAYTGVAGTGAALAALQRASGAAVACVTLSGAGSLAVCGGHEIRTPPFPVEVVDTTGAGDAFRAGFIGGWLRLGAEAALEDVLRYANAVAALKCRRPGARAGLPHAAEVARFVQPFDARLV